MSKTIWKFPVPLSGVPQPVMMPADARVLHVATQNDEPYLWVELDPDAPRVVRLFTCVGTGAPIPPDCVHVGTFTIDAGRYVFHVYEQVTR